ncbi:MAG: monooxygenase, partial [Hydrogenophaga sp.]|nr:monooxygenase [Hydrogenophaga sp.]
AVLSLSLSQPFVGPLYHWRTSRPHEYAASPLNAVGDDNAAFDAGPGHGAPPRNIALGSGDFLLDHLDHRFALLLANDAADLPAALMAVLDELRQRGVPLQVIVVGAQGAVAGAGLSLPDTDGHLRRRHGLRSGGAYLLRPDQHVCARWIALDARRLRDAVLNACGLKR